MYYKGDLQAMAILSLAGAAEPHHAEPPPGKLQI